MKARPFALVLPLILTLVAPLAAHDVPEGIDPARSEEWIDKFHEEDGLLVVRAGGSGAGQSAVIGGWSAQRNWRQVKIVSQEVTE